MSATCKHREWLEDDELFASGPECGAVAEWLSCTPIIDQPACEKHRCRCRKPIGSAPSDVQARIDALVRLLAPPVHAEHEPSAPSTPAWSQGAEKPSARGGQR